MAKRILLVDDEKETAAVFETGLKSAGYDVTVAFDGKSALEEARKGGWDYILLDQMLPDISGNDILKTLKTDEATKSMPVAMLTNFGHDELIKEALNAGAVDYILKYQISTDDLVAKVRNVVGE